MGWSSLGSSIMLSFSIIIIDIDDSSCFSLMLKNFSFQLKCILDKISFNTDVQFLNQQYYVTDRFQFAIWKLLQQ